jgi:putative addiction module component (TIGR02574 family)
LKLMTDPTVLRALPLEQRLKLIEDLWDSIEADTDALPLPDWHRAEIDRRLDALDTGASVGAPWEEVRRRIAGKP